MSEEEANKGKKRGTYERILKALNEAPIYEGFTVKELSREINMPEPTARWHLEILDASGKIESSYVGKTKLYKIAKKKQEE